MLAKKFQLVQSSNKKLSVPKDLNYIPDNLVEPKNVCIPQTLYPSKFDGVAIWSSSASHRINMCFSSVNNPSFLTLVWGHYNNFFNLHDSLAIEFSSLQYKKWLNTWKFPYFYTYVSSKQGQFSIKLHSRGGSSDALKATLLTLRVHLELTCRAVIRAVQNESGGLGLGLPAEGPMF